LQKVLWTVFDDFAFLDFVKRREPSDIKGYRVQWSERQDLNLRPLDPQSSALAKLSHAPTTEYILA
jgi:hypothetical protein